MMSSRPKSDNTLLTIVTVLLACGFLLALWQIHQLSEQLEAVGNASSGGRTTEVTGGDNLKLWRWRVKRGVDRELVEDVQPVSTRHTKHPTVAGHFVPAGNGNVVGNCDATVWQRADYTTAASGDFVVERGGVRLQRAAGVYYLYAQLYYYHPRNLLGFSVKRNGVNVMTCVVSAHTQHAENKTNSCHVAALVHLTVGDHLRVHNHHAAQCIHAHDKTFFGFFQVVKSK